MYSKSETYPPKPKCLVEIVIEGGILSSFLNLIYSDQNNNNDVFVIFDSE